MMYLQLVPEKYFLYILRCSDDSLYTGIARDLKRRLADHAAGKGSKYVRSRLPFELVYKKAFLSKSRAMKRELFVKSLSRKDKLELIGDARL